MNHYLRAFVISFFLTGCGNHLVFEPNKLPDGYIDQEYYVPITISGGTGPVVDLSYEIHPSNSGLKLVFSEKKYYTKYVYNNFTMEGANKQVISSQADSLIKISRIWADFFPANISNQPI
nr:hypothetical protein [Klebsiella pneumoniae]